MKFIEEIQINYLRSLYTVKLSNLSHLNVISGVNDIGKSNVLKALNLFFNSEVDWQTPFDFTNDLSFERRDDPAEASKKFISIVITFRRPDNYSTLPPTFQVKRQWNRYDNKYQQPTLYKPFYSWCEQNKVNPDSAERSVTRYLRSIDYKYVPAVKDRKYFQYLLSEVQESLVEEHSDPKLEEAAANLNELIRSQTHDLRSNFESLTGVATEIEIPTSALSLLKAAGIVKAGKVLLTMRGDGIQAAFIPSLLHFISDRARSRADSDEAVKSRFIWGFEEPENSLEYGKAKHLAGQFLKYADRTQIFLTTHSPAFIGLEGHNLSIHRVYRTVENNNRVNIATVYFENKKLSDGVLETEMGILDLAHELNRTHNIVTERQKELQDKADLARKLSRPAVFVEGNNDVVTLETAWKKLYPQLPCPFDVISSDPTGEEVAGEGSGGVDAVCTQLESVRHDSPRLVVGMFDHDDAALNKFAKLSRNFDAQEDFPNGSLLRFATKRRKAVAMVIPVPTQPERSEYADKRNLPLEFYFSNQVLDARNANGYGLEFKFPTELEIKNPNGKLIKKITGDDVAGYLTESDRQVAGSGGKKVFAHEIVPSLPSIEFEAFRELFQIVCNLINKYEGQLITLPTS